MVTNRTPPTDADLIALDPALLLKRDTLLAERAWNRLGLEDQVRRWLAAPYETRVALAELAHQTRDFVHALPPQEIWLTIQTVGGADAMTLFHATSAEQVQFCLDVESWSKDRWLAAATFEWVRLIAACGEEKIVEFFTTVDEQFLGLFLKQWICVYVRIADEDIAEAIPWPRSDAPVTLDGVTYFQITDAQVEQWLRPMVELYGRRYPDQLRVLFLQLPVLLPSEQEDLAYQARTRRLAEAGFPAWDEAVAVYRRLPEREFDKIPRRSRSIRPAMDTPPLGFPLLVLDSEELLLREALRRVEESVREAAATELARLANRVVIADGHAISVEHTRAALQKAIAYVNLGLERMSQCDAAAAAQVLTTYWLTGLFQIGYSLVMQISEAARAWLAAHPAVRDIGDNDPATSAATAHERIRAAAWRWPKYYVGPHAPDGVLHRDFCTGQELASVQQAMT